MVSPATIGMDVWEDRWDQRPLPPAVAPPEVGAVGSLGTRVPEGPGICKSKPFKGPGFLSVSASAPSRTSSPATPTHAPHTPRNDEGTVMLKTPGSGLPAGAATVLRTLGGA